MKKFPIWQCILFITLHVHVYKHSSSVIFMSENIETLNALFCGSCKVMNVVSICNWHKLKKICNLLTQILVNFFNYHSFYEFLVIKLTFANDNILWVTVFVCIHVHVHTHVHGIK